MFFIFVAFYSAVCLPMYSLAVAHVNDFLKPDEIDNIISLDVEKKTKRQENLDEEQPFVLTAVSYTHLTLPTNREV